MSTDSRSFAVRGNQITHERLDDEVIAIDLERGFYFAMVGPAADIWTAVVEGADDGLVAALLAERYGIDAAVARQAVDDFVRTLLDEALIAARDLDAPSDDVGVPVLPDLTQPAVWSTPELERYDDMADLVLLDPIHQVDESGWPHLPPES
jgi:Coenzyme PQQ synthesis protein D (PqqD)